MIEFQLLELLNECRLSNYLPSRRSGRTRSFPMASHSLLTGCHGGIIPILQMSSRETERLPEVRATNTVLDGLKG